ncbi:MAG TPA: TRAP transporter small permease subunit [Candidatus Acidoferrum sp.]|nr:TRAP transporter small permease subunit [Candidatus Acidoferrum sp.]
MTAPGGLGKVDRGLAEAMRGVCIAAFVVLIVLVTTLILIRFAPLFSLGWADEIVEMAFAWMTFLGAAYLWRSRSHFRVDLIPTLLAGTRAGQVLEIGLSLVSLLFFLVFTYEGAVLTLRTVMPSPILAWPKALWYMIMPIAGFVMIGYTMRDLWFYLHGRMTLDKEAAKEGHA